MYIPEQELSIDHVQGHLPISIGTALGLQRLFGMDDDGQKNGNYEDQSKGLTDLWINVDTLCRNLFNSIPDHRALVVNELLLARELLYEIDRIVDIVKALKSNLVVSFYTAGYKDLATRYPHAKLRTLSTDQQKSYKRVQDMVVGELHKYLSNPQESSFRYHHFPNEIKSNKVLAGKTAIMTHVPLDLLSRHYFGSLALLESHTGVLKPRSLWYTKFYNGRELNSIPFLHSTLQIFGDSSMFSPQPIKLRQALVTLSQKNGWHVLTTGERIKRSIADIPDRQTAESLKVFF